MEYEQQYVLDFYDKVSKKFSDTRYKVWDCVKDYIDNISLTDTILEGGCGNGKNLYRKNMYGIDTCKNFVDICKSKGLNVIEGSILDIEYTCNTFNHTICIAVLHHISTEDRRKQAISELIRVTKVNGTIFLYVWALDIKNETNKKKVYIKQDNLIPFINSDNVEELRYCHLFVNGELELLVKDFDIKIEKSFYDKGNYGLIFKKLN